MPWPIFFNVVLGGFGVVCPLTDPLRSTPRARVFDCFIDMVSAILVSACLVGLLY